MDVPLSLESQVKYIRTIRIQIGKNNWDLETLRKSWEKSVFTQFQISWRNMQIKIVFQLLYRKLSNLKKRPFNRQNQNGILNYFFNDIEIAGRTKTFFLQIFLYHFKEKKCK